MTSNPDDSPERDRAAHEAERIRRFAERVRPNYDARPVTKAEWDAACGDDRAEDDDAS